MPGAAYSVPSPLPITWLRKGLSFASQPPAENIPIPAGWVASVRYLAIQVTTTFAGGTLPWGMVQVGDSVTVNKYAQVQIGNTATPAVAGTAYYTIVPPPAAGVATAGSATASGVGLSQSGLTGRNPGGTVTAGVGGPFLFSGGAAFGAASSAASTGLLITYTIPTGSGLAGIADIIMVYELSDVG